MIAGSPTELQPVLDAVTESAAKARGTPSGVTYANHDGEYSPLGRLLRTSRPSNSLYSKP